MKVPRMGAKAFEQCAGFLRIPGAKNPLDNTTVHPESYHIVEQMAKDLKCTVNELIADKELRRKINISNYVTPSSVCLPYRILCRNSKSPDATREKPSKYLSSTRMYVP